MYKVNVVETSEMPERMFRFLFDQGHVVEVGYGSWVVDEYMSEVVNAMIRGEGELYGDTSEAQFVDNWLRAQGATNGELILFAHRKNDK